MPNFLEIVKYIVDMMKRNKTFKLSDIGKRAFEDIKGFISKALSLVHTDYTKELFIYCYASEHTMTVILIQ